MTKCWLIRTKSNHILGPVSREKVIELLQNQSLKSEDELCRANGYWFYVREQELVDLYVMQGKIQPFNPISEARDVLSAAPEVSVDELHITDIVPPVHSISDDTLVGANIVNLQDFQKKKNEPVEKRNQNTSSLPLKQKQASTSKTYQDSKKFQILIVTLFMLLILVVYFRKIIFSRTVSHLPSFSLLEAVHAQTEIKKKAIFPL